MTSRYLSLLLFTILATACSQASSAAITEPQSTGTAQPSAPVVEDIVISPGDFLNDSASGMALLPEGIMPNANAAEGSYVSQPTNVPIKFNAVVPQWKIDKPGSAQFSLELRTGSDPATMGEWMQIQPSMDWTRPEDEDIVGDMLVVPAQDITHDYFQYKLMLSRDADLGGPLLRELKFTFIDSTAGLSVEEMIVHQKEIDQAGSQDQTLAAQETDTYPRPFVISRQVWCTNPACNYTDDLSYHPVTHLLLHHTVSSTGEDGDPAAVVRAIWAFHAITRDWGDIGYNYLVDTKGVIYEGHLGGDDVVGIHAAGANTGSMALAMLGTYTQLEPPQPMLESAADLFAWKADQNDINVFDASDALPNIEWGLPHLMGHRDVYGTTECPGGVAHALIPTLREKIAARIGLENPHIYVDELSNEFTRSAADWYVGPLQCGHNAHSWYTWSTTTQAESATTGEWRPEVPENGRYRIEVYAPYCNTGRPETTGAEYVIVHADGTSGVTVNQDDRVGLWTSLGEYALLAGNSSFVRLNALTSSDDARGMWFDAIRLLPLEVVPSAITELPTDGSMLTERTVNFTWQIQNPEKVKATVLQVATDEQFENRVANRIWSTPVQSASHEFLQDYAALYWRVVVTTASGNEYPSAVSRFGIDSEPPTSTVTHLYWLEQAGFYHVFWQGADALTGVDWYSIEYRMSGLDGQQWHTLLSSTKETSVFFSPPDPAAAYEFRSRAADVLGNEEVAHTLPDISTDEATLLTRAVLLPLLIKD